MDVYASPIWVVHSTLPRVGSTPPEHADDAQSDTPLSTKPDSKATPVLALAFSDKTVAGSAAAS